jgi:hypothetical protein
MNRHVNAIAGRLSLRPPQRRSLEILDRITEIVPPKEGSDAAAALEVFAATSQPSRTSSVSSRRCASHLPRASARRGSWVHSLRSNVQSQNSEAKKRFGLCVLDYIVTSNHIHLLVKDTGANVIAESMQLI